MSQKRKWADLDQSKEFSDDVAKYLSRWPNVDRFFLAYRKVDELRDEILASDLQDQRAVVGLLCEMWEDEKKRREREEASSSRSQVPPALQAISTETLDMPNLTKFIQGQLLDVSGFKNFLAANTAADHPILLRKPLLDVHAAALKLLVAEAKPRLVSLVGCPGIGKTWCGWLVLYALETQKKRVSTLHVTFRGDDVIAVANIKHKRKYTASIGRVVLLQSLICEANCQVCVVDVGELPREEMASIFRGVRTSLIESFHVPATVKFLCLMSGHGESTIIGKPSLAFKSQPLVLWSWTEKEVDDYVKKMTAQGKQPPPFGAHAVCGGSVRLLYDVERDSTDILAAVTRMDQMQLERFTKLDLPSSNADHNQESSLLAFYPKPNRCHSDGMSAALILPRSAFVIRCLKENTFSSFKAAATMYKVLSNLNDGAAGTAFEQLVHIFWREKERDAIVGTDKKPVELTLVDMKGSSETIRVDVCSFNNKPGSIESWTHSKKCPPDGYFEPESRLHSVVDSVLRFQHKGRTRALALQISIGQKHGHDEWQHCLLRQGRGANAELALWDCPRANKHCVWSPKKSPSWNLLHIRCPQFDDRLVTVGIINPSSSKRKATCI